MGFSDCCGRTSCELVSLKCSCYDWFFFSITRFTKDHIWLLNQRGNWGAKLVRSLTKIFCRVEDYLTRLHLTKYMFNCVTYPFHGPFGMMGFIIMSIDQQIRMVGRNKLKDEARPELRCTSITPKNNFCQCYMFLHFFDDETNTHQRCYPWTIATLIEVFCSYFSPYVGRIFNYILWFCDNLQRSEASFKWYLQ